MNNRRRRTRVTSGTCMKVGTADGHYQPINSGRMATTGSRQGRGVRRYGPIPPASRLKSFFAMTLAVDCRGLLSISLDTLYLH